MLRSLARWAVPLGVAAIAAATPSIEGDGHPGTTFTSGPAQAQAGKQETWEFTCLNAYAPSDFRWLLGDNEDYTDPGARTVVLNPKTTKGLPSDVADVLGKRVKAKGVIGIYKGKRQLRATSVEIR